MGKKIINEDLNKSEIATRLKELRSERDIKVKDLAEQLDVSHRYVNKWEKEKIIPSLPIMAKISKIFKVSVDYILFGGVKHHE